MRRTFLAIGCAALLIATSLCSPVSADTASFKITDYIPEKFTDFEWKVDGSSSISGSDKDYFRDDHPPDAPIPEYDMQDRTDWSLTFGNDVQYSFRTPDKFHSLGLMLDVTVDGAEESNTVRQDIPSSESLDRDISVRSYNFTARPEVEIGFYLVEDLFVSTRLSAFLDYDQTPVKNRFETIERTAVTDLELTTLTTISSRDEPRLIREYKAVWERTVGWGRVYEGRYASTAMYMIEELRSKNALQREPTNEEMLALCDIVYRNRLTHAIDSRLRRMEIFEEIMTFLTEKKIIQNTGTFGYLAIEDVWDYFPRRPRRFGYEVTLSHIFDYTYDSWEMTITTSSDYLTTRYYLDSADVVDTLSMYSRNIYTWCKHRWETFLYYLNGSLAVYMPLSRRWQLDLDLTAEYTLGATCNDEYFGECVGCVNCGYCRGAHDEFRMGLITDAEYILDSRTSILLGSALSYRNVNGNYWEADVDAALEYRLSVPTTLVAAARIGHYRAQPDHSWELDKTSYSLSVSLQHYLY